MKYAFFLLLLGFLLCGCSKKEPIVDGTPLSSWLTNHIIGDSKLADQVLENVGTNAIPTLLRMLQQKDKWQNQSAYFAFLKLGARAETAVPALIQIYESKISPFSQQCAASSLGRIGPAANKAIPVLIRGLTNKNSLVRRETLSALGALHSQPDLVVPAITKVLSTDLVGEVRRDACLALEDFGEEAKQAVPVLVTVLKDPDRYVRDRAGAALKKIDPEAASQAGVQ